MSFFSSLILLQLGLQPILFLGLQPILLLSSLICFIIFNEKKNKENGRYFYSQRRNKLFRIIDWNVNEVSRVS